MPRSEKIGVLPAALQAMVQIVQSCSSNSDLQVQGGEGGVEGRREMIENVNGTYSCSNHVHQEPGNPCRCSCSVSF